MSALICFSFFLLICGIFAQSNKWDDVTSILNNGISASIYPGYVALVGYRNGTILYQKAGGTFVYPNDPPPPYNYGSKPPMTMDTHFDMASITKLLATTTAILKLIENESNIHSLFDPIAKYLGAAFAVNNKSSIQIINCLLHNAGFYPDPYPNWFNSKAFGCPQSTQYHPILTFDCANKIYSNTLSQPLYYQTGTQMIYSDLSFMTLSYLIATIVKNNAIITKSDVLSICLNKSNTEIPLICYFEAYARIYIFGPNALNMTNTSFLPLQYQNPNYSSRIAPTCNSTTTFNHQTLQGIVEDPNSFANGGIFGHAGIFSTARDVYKWGISILKSAYEAIPVYNYSNPHPSAKQKLNSVNKSKIYFDPQWTHLFLTKFNSSFSSRALGFDTNDFDVDDFGGDHVCGTSEYGAFETVAMHTGFTGTLFCLDRERDLIYILLTNRVYPDPNAQSLITSLRRNYSNALLQAADQYLHYSNDNARYSKLYKQCNDTWRDDTMSSEKYTLCSSWSTGSLITSLAMGLNAYDILLDGEEINPSNLNAWIKEKDGYNEDNELVNGSIIEGINQERIKFVGRFDNLSFDELKKLYLNETVNNIVVGNAVRRVDQQQYGYRIDIHRYVNIIGYSDMNSLIARDPLLYQMEFINDDEQNGIIGNYWIWFVSS